MPSEHAVDAYIDALDLYCRLLRQQRTCWYCANLQRLRGLERRFICIHNAHLLSLPARPGADLPSLTAGEAKLLTSLEGCHEAHFQRRTGAREVMPLEVWRDRIAGGGGGACCADCLHLRSVVVAGRQRYLCALEADAGSTSVTWRLARSWRVVQTRRGSEVWCRGSHWCPRLGDVAPLAEGKATA